MWPEAGLRGEKMKRIMYVLGICFSVFVLASCHGKLKAENRELKEFIVPEEFDETKTYEISFWAKNDTNIVQQNIYKQAIENFQKIYPNIKVNITPYSDYTEIYNDVIKNIATKTTPNLCIAYPDHVATYMDGEDVVVPLDSLMNDEEYGMGGSKVKFASTPKEQYISKFLEEGKIGKYYCTLPFMRSTEALYVNKTYLEEHGYDVPDVFTWDYLWEICDNALKNTTEGQMIPMIYKSTDNMFIQLCKQKGYDFTTEKGKVLFLSDDVKSMLLGLTQQIDKGYFDTFKRVSYPGNMFNKGQCIFAIDSTAGSTWLGSKAPLLDIPASEIVDFETVVRPIPQVDVNNPQMISQGPSLCLFNKENPQEVMASWLLMQYLLTDDTQIQYAETEGYLPVTKTAMESETFQTYLKNPEEYDVKRAATQLIIDHIDHTFITPVFNGSSLCRSAAGYLIEAVFNKQYRDGASIDKLFNTVNTRYKLADYEIK